MAIPDVRDAIGIDYPIFQAGLGPTRTVELAAAVSNAGGLGTVSQGGVNLSKTEAKTHTRTHLKETVELTDEPIAMNVPVGNLDSPIDDIGAREAYLMEALRLKRENDTIGEQLKVVITSYGSPERRIDDIQAVKDETDLLHFHKVAKVKHAKKMAAMGVDGLVAAGYEMGGHTHPQSDAVSTFTLVPNVVDAVEVPVIAAGGMKDGKSLAAALSFGAAGISLGTRFLTAAEMPVDEGYKQHIVDSAEGQDVVVAPEKTPHRVIESPGSRAHEEAVADATIGEIREMEVDRVATAQTAGNVEKGMVTAGQIGTYIDDTPPAAEIIDDIMTGAREMHAAVGEQYF
jgi:NAD(P)H-dependent flavin oxidoreductase YrpB (nitropropane dioxygenase family)